MQRRSQRGVEHSGGRAGRGSLWSGKGSSARVESGTRLWRGSLEPLPIGIPRLQAGEDVNSSRSTGSRDYRQHYQKALIPASDFVLIYPVSLPAPTTSAGAFRLLPGRSWDRFPLWGTPPERRQPHEALPAGRRSACARQRHSGCCGSLYEPLKAVAP